MKKSLVFFCFAFYFLGESSLFLQAQKDNSKVIGPEQCVMCHKREGKVWKRTHHYKTFSQLHRRGRSKTIAQNLGMKGSFKRKGLCRNCHYTVRGENNKAIYGISCESCHGPARDWVSLHSRRDIPKEERDKLVDKAGMLRPDRIYHVAENCYQCHSIPNEKLVNVGGHPHSSRGFNLMTWSQGEIRHNFLSGEGRNRKITQAEKRIFFVVGAGLEFEYGLRGFAKATKKANYSLKMSRKIRVSRKKLIRMYKASGIREIRSMYTSVKSLKIKLNNEAAFLRAADKVKQVIIDFSFGYTGNEKKLAKLDALMNGELDEISLSPEKASLYKRIGGAKAVETAVKIFYGKVLKDERVQHFFKGVDIDRQIEKQKAFLTLVFGGPSYYEGKDLREAHKHLVVQGLNDGHVDVVLELLGETLEELGVAKSDIEEVMKISRPMRKYILNK